MGYGPNIITAAADRLETGIGNWYPDPDIPGQGFVWDGDKADLYCDNALGEISAILEKDFFEEIEEGPLYTMTFSQMWPFSPPNAGVDFSIESDAGQIWLGSIGNVAINIWYPVTFNLVNTGTFDNDTRYIKIYYHHINPARVDVYLKNMAIRKYTAAKTDHLPLMGVH
jgi:hypothetical protein